MSSLSVGSDGSSSKTCATTSLHRGPSGRSVVRPDNHSRQVLSPQSSVNKDSPDGADLLPVRTQLDANLLDDVFAPLQDANNVAEAVPPVLEPVVAFALRHTVELETERLHFVLPPPRGDRKVALRGEVAQTRVVGEQRRELLGEALEIGRGVAGEDVEEEC